MLVISSLKFSFYEIIPGDNLILSTMLNHIKTQIIIIILFGLLKKVDLFSKICEIKASISNYVRGFNAKQRFGGK